MAVFRLAFCCVLLIFWLTAPAGTQLYRCTDAQGNVELQQTTCASGQQDDIFIEDIRVGWVPPKVKAEKRKSPKKSASRIGSTAQKKRDREKQQKSCWKSRQKLERIEWKLRRGYKASQGDKLRFQQDQHESYLRKFC